MSTPQLCFLAGRMVEPAVSGNKPHKIIRIAKRPEYNPTDFHEYALIVRCKDCKYFCQEGWTDGITGDCMNFYEVYDYDFCQFTTTIDGFCAWGKRKVVEG